MVTARKIKDTFPKHLSFCIWLFTLTPYTRLLTEFGHKFFSHIQERGGSPVYPLNLLTHLTDMLYNIEIVKVLIVQIADYMKLWNDGSIVHLI